MQSTAASKKVLKTPDRERHIPLFTHSLLVALIIPSVALMLGSQFQFIPKAFSLHKNALLTGPQQRGVPARHCERQQENYSKEGGPN